MAATPNASQFTDLQLSIDRKWSLTVILAKVIIADYNNLFDVKSF